jgi:outer membrane protein assembly factor BamB
MLRRLATLALIVAACSSLAADWPQWLGPNRNGVSTEIVAPWSSPPKAIWRKPVGDGNGGPVVAGGKVYILTKVKDKDQEEVIAFDATTGNEIWRSAYDRPPFTSLYGTGPRSTPTVVDGRVYTMGVTCLLTCFDAASGKQIWQTDVLKEFSASRLTFGSAVSPLVDNGRVYVMAGAKNGALAAFNASDGKLVWKDADDHATYSSPIMRSEGDATQLLFLAQSGIVALAPGDGKVFWRVPLVDKLLESSSTPAICGDTLLASSITFGSLGIKLGMKDGKVEGKEIWKNPALTCYFATPVGIGADYFYVVTGSRPGARPTVATLHAVEAKTGKVLWSRPKVGTYHASLMRTGDNKLLMLEEVGDLVLVDPDPKEYRELARAKVCGDTWAHPALSDGRLYLRDSKELICLPLAK